MEKLLLIDGHSILSRAYYGIPLLTTGDGRPTNAVYGFMNILLKVIAEENPQYLGAAFDLDRRKLRRTAMYPEYKGTRKPMPEELLVQVPVLQKLLEAMKIPVWTLEGYEADDLLGTLAFRAAAEGLDAVILTGDRDLLQLAAEHIRIVLPKTSRGVTEVFHYTPEDVEREYHVSPSAFIDLKALMGDTSDNIPGLPGIGPKTAGELMEKYGSMENAKAHQDELRPPRAQAAFRDHYDLAVLSRKLAEIDTAAPLEADYRSGKAAAIYTEAAQIMLRELELKTLAVRFAAAGSSAGTTGGAAEEKLPSPRAVRDPFLGSVVLKDAAAEKQIGLSFYSCCKTAEDTQLSLFEEENLPGVSDAALGLLFTDGRFYLLRSSEEWKPDRFLEDLRKLFSAWTGKGTSVCCFHTKELIRQIPEFRSCRYEDIPLAAYLINPLRGDYAYDTVAKDYNGTLLKSPKELLPKGSSWSEEITALEAWTALKTASALRERLSSLGMEKLYQTVELPLIPVLADMERIGIRADRKALRAYSEHLKKEASALEEEIYAEAGQRFNINSPSQLGTVLFEKLGLPGAKKTKTGYSTAAEVLEKLADEHEIVRHILRYRTVSKLNSTYAEGLEPFIAEDGRIHGTFHQTVTATGRLSSADPNLQNIPVRTEEGREFRKVFRPAEGCVFVDADYSQVELRILASLSRDQNLIEAYRSSSDIHTLTASRVFHVPVEQVTPELRRNAKAVNFGIVYGISAFGLGEDLSISRKEALSYIDSYFELYPQVRSWLDEQVKKAKEEGAVATLFGRRRPVPELKSSSYMERSFGERVAMNAPVQGTAADIIKIAMVRAAERFSGIKSRIVLQVHDELLVEAPEAEAEEACRILREEMEHAAELPVTLEVEVRTGADWNECH